MRQCYKEVEQVDRFKGDFMMMVMELTDGAENEICFRSTHLHPHTEKLEQFMQKLNSESQKSPPSLVLPPPYV